MVLRRELLLENYEVVTYYCKTCDIRWEVVQEIEKKKIYRDMVLDIIDNAETLKELETIKDHIKALMIPFRFTDFRSDYDDQCERLDHLRAKEETLKEVRKMMRTYKPLIKEEIERIDEDDRRGYFDWEAYYNRLTFWGKIRLFFGM